MKINTITLVDKSTGKKRDKTFKSKKDKLRFMQNNYTRYTFIELFNHICNDPHHNNPLHP